MFNKVIRRSIYEGYYTFLVDVYADGPEPDYVLSVAGHKYKAYFLDDWKK